VCRGRSYPNQDDPWQRSGARLQRASSHRSRRSPRSRSRRAPSSWSRPKRTFTGFSSFLVVDTRVRYRFDWNWCASVGVDNLNNKKYRAFDPYPQRTFLAELAYDL
jgi:outer membrane receptor protein involved in Fe transport